MGCIFIAASLSQLGIEIEITFNRFMAAVFFLLALLFFYLCYFIATGRDREL